MIRSSAKCFFFSFKAVQCEVLAAPADGGFLAPCGNTYQDVCEFKCNDGYVLQGTSSRTCQSNKIWSGSLVQCQSK